jgi:ABC-type phosphate transport system substrate-binding protein
MHGVGHFGASHDAALSRRVAWQSHGSLFAVALFTCSCLSTVTGCAGSGSDAITRVSRQNNSGTYHYFREVVLGNKDFKSGSIDLSGSKDVVELVARTPSAIGYSGMGYATDQVKMLQVSQKKGEPGVAPTVEHAKDGTYPLARPLYIYTVGEPSGATKAYIDWILSEAGQELVRKTGYVPMESKPLPPADAAASAEPVSITVTGSDTMVNLAAAWAEEYGKQHSHVRVEVSGGGSGVGIASLIDGTADLTNSSREMTQEEKDKAKSSRGNEVREFVVALDALAIYVHKANPRNEISIEELAGIFGEGGTIERWSQLSQATAYE